MKVKNAFLKLGVFGLSAGLAFAQNQTTDSQFKLIQLERDRIAELRAQEDLATHPPALSPETEARLRELLRAKMAEFDAPIHVATLSPISPEPVAKTTREKLADLNEQYKDNKISAGEYHRKRAQVVSQL